jgi:hypothetical protein
MTKKELIQSPEASTSFFYGYIIVAVIFVIQIIMFGSAATSGVFFKPILYEFGWSRALLSGAFSFSRIAQGLSTANGLADMINSDQ